MVIKINDPNCTLARNDRNQYPEKVTLPNDHHLALFFNGAGAVLEEAHP